MANALLQRCFNHASREAAARCPECKRYFCRECITEHEDRVVCSACLKTLARVPMVRRRGFVWFFRIAHCVASLIVAWFFFFVIGNTLLKIPAAYHEGTLWQAK